MPDLFIVAGPNGAGKSLFSSTLTSTSFEVFDGDKHMASLKAKYPASDSAMRIPEKVLYWENGKILFTAASLPLWVQGFIKNAKKK